MKTIIRNLLSVTRRFQIATTLNLMGLAIAFAAFIVIMMQVNYDLGFNKSITDADRIFRIDTHLRGHQYGINSRYLVEELTEKMPSVVAGGISDFFEPLEVTGGNSFFSIDRNGERSWFSEMKGDISAGLIDVFSFEMIEGTAESIKEPNTVLIPESMARKMFGTEPAVQRELSGEGIEWVVGGVYKDFSKNTSVANVIYKEIGPDQNNNKNYGNLSYIAYVKLDKPESAERLIDDYIAMMDLGEEYEKENLTFSLSPLTDLHFMMNTEFDSTPKTSRAMLLVMIGIAFVILLIATINFTNYSIALTPLRIKSINTQKVLGATEAKLRSSLVIEAVLTCFLAWMVALIIVYALPFTPVTQLLDAPISLMGNIGLVAITGGVAAIVGLFAGLYPAFYMTSFAPALVLKGSFGLSPKGRQLRNTLVSIQFVTSFVLIITAMFMYLQTDFVKNQSMGFDKEQLIIVDLNADLRKSLTPLKHELLRSADIEQVAYSTVYLSGADDLPKWGRGWNDEQIMFQIAAVGLDYLETAGIPLTDGRDFLSTDEPSIQNMLFIFNEKARTEFGFKVGDKLDGGEIVGFVPNVNATSLRKEIEPMAFSLHTDQMFGTLNYANIRVSANADPTKAIQHIKASLQQFSPDYSFTVRIYDEVLNSVYAKESNLALLISLFSLIAVLISIVGVFGLVVFESEYKRKEIGVRKVLGSTTAEILAMFNKRYVQLLFFCFVVAAPVAWYAINSWLQSFAYKTPIYWWVFAIALLTVTLITLSTVTFQSWRVANANPVESIKTE